MFEPENSILTDQKKVNGFHECVKPMHIRVVRRVVNIPYSDLRSKLKSVMCMLGFCNVRESSFVGRLIIAFFSIILFTALFTIHMRIELWKLFVYVHLWSLHFVFYLENDESESAEERNFQHSQFGKKAAKAELWKQHLKLLSHGLCSIASWIKIISLSVIQF